MFKPVDPKQSFPELEKKITKFWKENKIFEKSVQNRDPKNSYIFYDGPPFITGTPHYGSLLPSIAKDVVPRYHTIRGKRVERIWGWDCHGLPIENKVEKKLGIANRREIEKFGIQKFIDECYNYTRDTSAEWRWYIDKIGRWVDMDNAYRTMDQDYMETVMWVFKELYDKDLIYKGVRTSLFCTRCGTPVSNFEIAMDNSYSDMEDPAVTVKFPVTTPGKFQGKSILAWTTTPWTLPSNKALVIDPKETYVTAKVQKLEIELEQGWLVEELPADLKKVKKSEITQAYFDDYLDENGIKPRDTRVRKIDDNYEFTVKYYAGSEKETGQLIENTRKITKDEYIELIKKASKKVVKTRYYYPLGNGLTAEIDVYRNQHDGINVVEVEFSSLSKLNKFTPPDWFGKEITDSSACYPPYMADRTVEELKAELEMYAQAEHNYDEQVQEDEVILAKKRVEYVLKDMDYEITEEFKGKELLGLSYTPPFSYFPTEKGEHQVYSFEDMVHMEEGTGIVHSAPGFGDIDTEMGQEKKLTIAMSIGDDGKYFPIVKDFEGMYVKDADPVIMENLKSRGLLFKSERIVHRYPYCYRCETPLIHKAQPSWFINIDKIRKDLLKNNEEINWVPDHLKHGRFKKGIEVAPDWGISRTRYWASPMPVWQREEGGEIVETMVVGSRDEIREKAVQPITKLTLIRHAERDKSSPDGSLTKKGQKQAATLADKFKTIRFDAIYSGSTKRTVETVEPLAKSANVEIKVDDIFGNLKERKQLDLIFEKLEKKHNLSLASELPESELKTELSEIIDSLHQDLAKFLNKHRGKHIIASTHGERIALIKHIVEGKSLTEGFASMPGKGQSLDLYFNGTELLDLHRPKIDNITLKGKTGELARVKEVLDVWMDSASMPYASKHYPFENKQTLEDNYPADFIVEYIAQTRAWFYVMHVVSTALLNQPSFKNVVTTGVMSGNDGRKMSKSYGNYPDPRETLEKYGAEPLRLYFMGSRIMVGEDMNFDEEALKEQVKTFILPLWNSYSFFVTYANIHNWTPEGTKNTENKKSAKSTKKSDDPLDQWIIAQLELSRKDFITAMEAYNIPAAVRVLPEFVDLLSRWYIRRSRQHFADGNKQALATLHYVLVEFAKLCSPIVPFLSEDIFLNLADRSTESVHLSDLADFDDKFITTQTPLLNKMNIVRIVSTLGQSLRVQNSLKVRQPLSEIAVKIDKEDWLTKQDIEWMTEIIKDELNVKKVSFVSELPTAKGWLTIESASDQTEQSKHPEQNIVVDKDVKVLGMPVLEASTSANLVVALDSRITPELENEGLLRELTRQIQNQRKKSGLKMGELVDIKLETDDQKLITAIKSNLKDFQSAVNAKSLEITKEKQNQTIKVNEIAVTISID